MQVKVQGMQEQDQGTFSHVRGIPIQVQGMRRGKIKRAGKYFPALFGYLQYLKCIAFMVFNSGYGSKTRLHLEIYKKVIALDG